MAALCMVGPSGQRSGIYGTAKSESCDTIIQMAVHWMATMTVHVGGSHMSLEYL